MDRDHDELEEGEIDDGQCHDQCTPSDHIIDARQLQLVDAADKVPRVRRFNVSTSVDGEDNTPVRARAHAVSLPCPALLVAHSEPHCRFAVVSLF